MNGVRSISMRRGWLPSTLAALVLVYGSPDALAQELSLAGATTVAEDSRVQVTAVLTVPALTAAPGGPITVTLTAAAVIDAGSTGDPNFEAEVDASGDIGFEDTAGAPTQGDLTTDLEFTWSLSGTSQTIRRSVWLHTYLDDDAEDEKFTIEASNGGDITFPTATEYTINDDETQTYLMYTANEELTFNEDLSGASIILEARPPISGSVVFRINLASANDSSDYGFGAATSISEEYEIDGRVEAGGHIGPTVSIESVAGGNDGDRIDDTLTVSSTWQAGTARGQKATDDLVLTVTDVHKLPSVEITKITVPDEDGMAVEVDSVEEGQKATVTLTADRGTSQDDIFDNETVTIALALDDSSTAARDDYSTSRLPVMIGASTGTNGTGTFDVDVDVDDDLGAESLVFMATVSGESQYGSETKDVVLDGISLVDTTVKRLEPKSEDEAYPVIMDAISAGAGDEGLNPGESFMLMADDLFMAMTGYTVQLSVSVEGDSVSGSASGDSVTLNAQMAGESKVTVTGTAQEASASFMPEQTISNVASITFPVEVVDKQLVVMLEMPDNVMEGNIVEGGSYDIVASANRMVTEAEGSVEVMIMRDRAASYADEDDYTVGSATIMAGYDSATAELMVTEDGMPDAGTNDNMGESLVLYGEFDGEETNSLTFTIWDQAVPTLPLIGQLVLALFLTLGGARLYRRRQG